MLRGVLLLTFVFLLSLISLDQLVYAQLVSIDIGDAANNPGSTKFEKGTYTIIGSGSDIWDSADGFRFAYTKVSGNFEAVVRQVSIELNNEWAKGGIHARQDTDPGAPNAQVIVTGGGGGGCQITWRSTKDGKSEEFLNVAPGPWKDDKCWLKLTREGDEFHGYISLDARNWIDLKSTKVKMSDPILVGLAMCGMNQPGKGVYDNFTITQNGKTIFPLAIESLGKLPVTWGSIRQNTNP
ncbi:TPA: DUF1349 domain-containing protein [Candidatus Poribacteria bacterium]|nr:DUF1349 domain-containing protein [Candidatus Poribacteria bacterium]